jgi:hypothetical protein
MRPMEANVVAGVPGNEIVFSRREDVDSDRLASLAAEKSNHDYAGRYRRIGRRQRLRHTLARGLQALRLTRY